MPAQADTSRMAKALLTTDERELVDRATLLPIGQYDDGSLTFAWPQFLKDAWEGGQRTFHQGRQLPRVDDTGNYVGTPRAENVDGLNVASMAPTAGVAGRMAGAVPRGALGSGGSDMVTKPKGITAYHGSPHDFDKFDLSKIGTGEGAQAYGHGLYFAESEGVARNYRDALSDGFALQRPDGTKASIPDSMRDVAADARDFGGDLSALSESYRKSLAEMDPTNAWDRMSEPMLRRKLAAVEDWLASGAQPVNPGRMYEVRINADPNDFLDWDKPLSQQSEKVRGALAPIYPDPKVSPLGSSGLYDVKVGGASVGAFPADKLKDVKALAMQHDPRTGAQIHESSWLVPGEFMDKSAASANLREAGIPGIRYLDQGSRGAGDGTYNYVIFDDALIDIMRKYANPETAALPGLMSFGSEPGGLLAGEPQQGLPPLLKRRY